VSASVPVKLTPLESLCFAQVKFWVEVVERNQGRSGRLVDGRPFTRLPASELVSTLEERFPFLSVTVRQVRLALNRLVELKLLVREQFWQRERWRSDYWYSQGDVGVTPESPVEEPRGDGDVTPSLKPLLSCLPKKTNGSNGQKKTTSSGEPTAKQPSSLDGGVVVTRGAQEPQEGALAKFSDGNHTEEIHEAPGATGRPLVRPVNGLSSVMARCFQLAGLPLTAEFDTSSLEPVSPRGVVIGGRLLRVDDGATSPLR